MRAGEPSLDGFDDVDAVDARSPDRLAHVGESAPGALLHRRPQGRPGIGCSMPAAPRLLAAAPAPAPDPVAIPGFLRAPARAGARIDARVDPRPDPRPDTRPDPRTSA